MARVGRLQADDRPQKHGFAGAGAADHADDLAPADREVEILVDHLLAEAVAEPAHLDDRLAAFGHSPRVELLRNFGHIHPMFEKKTAKTASSTITRKIDWTTAVVVRDADLLAVALDQHALEAARQGR